MSYLGFLGPVWLPVQLQGLRSLDPACALVKLKSVSKVVDQDMERRGGDEV